MANHQVPHYGVWVGTPTNFVVQTSADDNISPHIYLDFVDGSDDTKLQAAINVKSTDRDSRLVFWYNGSLAHEYVQDLVDLPLGFHRLGNQSGLDYLRRQGMFVLEPGRVLPHDTPGPDNDILDELKPILRNGINKKARVYLFGSQYDNRGSIHNVHGGIHDVHMNQGSLPRYENSVYRDGAFFLYFEEDDHWEGVFLAFASQRVPTNDVTGEPEFGSQELAKVINAA
jgi:uncharacterized protein YukJ